MAQVPAVRTVTTPVEPTVQIDVSADAKVMVAVPVPPDAETVIPEVAPIVALNFVDVAVKVA
jgi:hypothetical protein